MTRVRTVIVEDSPTARLLLEHIVSGDPRLSLVASLPSAEALLDRLESLAPDVISLDVRLPGMNGLEATLEIMRRRPTPVVVVAADAADQRVAMGALRAGALSVLEKPPAPGQPAFAAAARRLCDQLVLMSKVKVVRQVIRRELDFGLDGPRPAPPAAPPRPAGPFKALGLVASTGGPGALAEVLAGLGPDFPLPVLLVQHIGARFLDGFAAWLGQQVGMPVAVAAHGAPALAGTAHVAPGDRHLRLSGGRLELSADAAVDGQRPSGTVLLHSIAAAAGTGGIGVVMTGMGSDGAGGLAALSRAGGYAVIEDPSTAVVYGMPAAALAAGPVHAQLPLPAIAPHIRQLVARAGTEDLP